MTDNKHTPGPWDTATHISPDPIENDRFELCAGDKWIAKLTVADLKVLKAERDALRAALADLLERLDHMTTHDFSLGSDSIEREKARALLAGMEGE